MEMEPLPCRSTIKIFEPLEEFRIQCPKILVVCHGEHFHPIPLPSKTPPSIRDTIFRLLKSIDYDLPDLTPRRFLRHPIVSSYLSDALQGITNPTLADLHISLANRDHVGAFIDKAKEMHFPHGTGWDGK